MLRRLSFLLAPGTLLVLAGLTACAEAPEDEGAKQPPPVVATRSRAPKAAATGMQGSATMAAGSGTRVITAAPAANSNGTALRDAGAADDEDAGPSAGSGGHSGTAAGSGGTGAARAAAGSGGTGGMRAGGSGGRAAAGSGGAGGSGGQAGGQSDACSGQICFTVFDCWLLSSADCSYSDCDNFSCK